ncbi:MAG: FAD-binding oxidoreductase [Nitrosomonadales bacterium]|nr:FAD-binding oxidoreductase [Nitrosomonadales bacterium]
MASEAKLLETLAAIVGSDAVLGGDAATPYYHDWRGRYSGAGIGVVFPADTRQVSEVVKLCAANKVAMVPQGGNTSLCGGSVPLADGPRQLVINLSRMDRIRNVDAVNYTMTVEAGCKLASLYDAPEQADRLFPLGLTAIAPHCEIGGNLSTNAGGLNVLRYGTARSLVLGLEVVLPDGRIWDGLRSLRKDNSGYDLKQLFIGAEGTLGIITAAVLKLFPLPKSQATACIAVRDPAAAVALLAHLRATCGDTISAFELISRSCLDLVFKHIPGTQEPFADRYEWIVIAQVADVLPAPLDGALRFALNTFGEGIAAFEITANKEDAEGWWKLRKGIPDAQKAEGISIKHDVSVPISRVAEFITRASTALRDTWPGIRIVAFGHLGDGNIHYNVSLADATGNEDFIAEQEAAVQHRVYEVVDVLEGSISAEHGLGQLKREEIIRHKSALELELMRSIKQTFDPHGLMNPGKFIQSMRG